VIADCYGSEPYIKALFDRALCTAVLFFVSSPQSDRKPSGAPLTFLYLVVFKYKKIIV
jgi:hypothetical protein